MRHIDDVTGAVVIPLEEALEGAIREDADNPVLFRALWRAQDWALTTGQRGYVAYENVRRICRFADPNWPEDDDRPLHWPLHRSPGPPQD